MRNLNSVVSRVLVVGILSFFCSFALYGQGFLGSPPPLPQLGGTVDWADFDMDGLEDLIICGVDSTGAPAVRILRARPNNTFIAVSLPPGLKGMSRAFVSWADYDNDGDKDFGIIGLEVGAIPRFRIYRNLGGGSFSPISINLPGVFAGEISWLDLDGDGDQDLAVSGYAFGSGDELYLIRNDQGSFSSIPTPNGWGTSNSRLGKADLDGDNDTDMVLMGNHGENGVDTIYSLENNGSWSFKSNELSVIPTDHGGIDFGDFDQDGDDDLLIFGYDPIATCRVYTNDGNGNFAVHTQIPGAGQGRAKWGDLNNDSFPDIVYTGLDSLGNLSTRIFVNDQSGSFQPHSVTNPLPGARNGALVIHDFDGDGDLDITISGMDLNGFPIAKILRNDNLIFNY